MQDGHHTQACESGHKRDIAKSDNSCKKSKRPFSKNAPQSTQREKLIVDSTLNFTNGTEKPCANGKSQLFGKVIQLSYGTDMITI